MYTVTPAYSSNSALQYCAIFKLTVFSTIPFACAPGSLPPCPGSNTTTRLFIPVASIDSPFAPLLVVAAVPAFSSQPAFAIASSKVVSEDEFPSLSKVTIFISVSAANAATSSSVKRTSSGSLSTLWFTPNAASIPISRKAAV